MEFNFIQGCIDGIIDLSTIGDFVNTWHKSTSDKELYEFLGMTKEEYKLWVEYPDSLTLIIKNRKELNNKE